MNHLNTYLTFSLFHFDLVAAIIAAILSFPLIFNINLTFKSGLNPRLLRFFGLVFLVPQSRLVEKLEAWGGGGLLWVGQLCGV